MPNGPGTCGPSARNSASGRGHRPDLAAPTFTGSTAAGRRIGSICGERIARCTLELGGKSAAVILDDVDVATAAQTLASAECFLSGQVCSSLTRIVVPRSRHDELLEALAGTFSRVRVGDPFDAQTQMGPLAAQRQRDRVEGYIAPGKADGAALATSAPAARTTRHCSNAPVIVGLYPRYASISNQPEFAACRKG